jgi:hypothetical protein
LPYYDLLKWSSLASLAHLPAAVAPVGLDRQGLPCGVQIICAFDEDRSAVAIAANGVSCSTHITWVVITSLTVAVIVLTPFSAGQLPPYRIAICSSFAIGAGARQGQRSSWTVEGYRGRDTGRTGPRLIAVGDWAHHVTGVECEAALQVAVQTAAASFRPSLLTG